MQISETAIRLKDEAERQGAYLVLQQNYPGRTVSFPYYGRMADLTIDEMSLSVRASNALKRAGAVTARRVAELIAEDGLKTIRNLGIKSEREIIRSFFMLCYGHMTSNERLKFWENVVSNN